MEKSNVTSFPKGKVTKEKTTIANSLSPREIVSELDRFVAVSYTHLTLPTMRTV